MLVGIFFFAQPTFIFGDSDSEFSTLGLVFALASSILAASCFNIIRKIGKNVHYTVTVLYYSILGTIITAAIVLSTTGFNFPCSSEIGYLIYIGPNGIIGQSCLTMALQREKAGRVAIARTSQIFFAFLVQIYWIGETTNIWSIIGAVLGNGRFMLFRLLPLNVFNLNDSFLLVVDCGNSKTFVDKGLILCLGYLNKTKQKPRIKACFGF